MDVHRAASARPASGGRIRPCVLLWKCTRLRPHADRWSGAAAGPYVRVWSRRMCCVGRMCCVCRCARVVAPLLPRMKASPYLALSCPFTYSSVCSIAMFMKPSRHASTPVRRLASSACAKGSRARRHATSVVHARVELDHHRPPKHLLEELSGVVLRGGRRGRSTRRRHRWSLGWAEITGQRAIFLTKPRTAPLRYCTKHLQQCRQKRSACAVAVPSHRGHVALSVPTPASRHSVTFG